MAMENIWAPELPIRKRPEIASIPFHVALKVTVCIVALSANLTRKSINPEPPAVIDMIFDAFFKATSGCVPKLGKAVIPFADVPPVFENDTRITTVIPPTKELVPLFDKMLVIATLAWD